MALDWKTKYLDIRAKLKEATDVSYRLGYERGMKDGTQAAAMQQMQQQAQMQQAMMQGGGQPGAEQGGEMPPGEEQGGEMMPPGAEQGGEMPPDAEGGAPAPEAMGDQQGGSELDQHINELQSLVAKGEKPSVLDIRKAVIALAGIRKNQKNTWQKKTEQIIPAQKKVVENLLKKWEDEAKKPSQSLEAIIKEHGLKVEE